MIRAEISGQVGRARLEVGARVTGPADLLTTIDELDPVYVTFRPSSQQLLTWQRDPRGGRSSSGRGAALAVRVILPDGSLLPRTGQLDFVAPSLDSATGTAGIPRDVRQCRPPLAAGPVRAGAARGLRPRQRARRSAARGACRRWDASSCTSSGPATPCRARREARSVERQLWIIEHGLAAGDRVVVDGMQKVAPGRSSTRAARR